MSRNSVEILLSSEQVNSQVLPIHEFVFLKTDWSWSVLVPGQSQFTRIHGVEWSQVDSFLRLSDDFLCENFLEAFLGGVVVHTDHMDDHHGKRGINLKNIIIFTY